jgi:hypothetical protein
MMKNLIRRAIAATAVAAFALSFLAVTPAMAVEEPGYGPYSALSPSAGWTSLAPGESRWYTFHYDYDQMTDIATEATVELQSQYEDTINFEIWTPRTVQHWINDDDTDTWNPVGAGTKLSEQTGDDVDDNTLVWTSEGSVSETYYVIVTNARDTVSFPGLALPAATLTTETPQIVADDTVMALAAAAPSADLAVGTGYGPFTALAIGDDTGVLAAGESRWYSFEYAYTNSDDSDVPADVTVFVKGNTEDALSFEVWNPQTVQHWINADDSNDWNAVGAGSKLSNDIAFDNNEQESLINPYKNELIWVGSSRASDTYYVVVTNDTDQSQSYLLSITGSTISF